MSADPYLGIIEGFYGQRYHENERSYLFDFCAHHGYRFYIYAPKEDAQLRATWQQPMSAEYRSYLTTMATAAHERKLDFGVALSPMNLTANFATMRDTLLTQVKELCAATKCEIFCLLFDDMVKDSEDVGKAQNEVIMAVEQILPEHVSHFIICPSYYCDDPILDKLFGQCPEHYFSDLTAGLPERVEIFWTGDKVLSEDITPEYIDKVTTRLGRKPFIWDNYPVNDGKKICSYLFLNKFKGRTGLAGHITGHAVNPMVQPLLSTLAEVTLPLIYEGKSPEEINSAHLKQAKSLFGAATSLIIKYDNFNLLTKVGRAQMSEQDKARFLEFCAMDDKPALKELADFIQGSARFDQSIVSGEHKID